MIPVAPGTLTVVIAAHFSEASRFVEGLSFYAEPGQTLRFSYLKRGPTFARNRRLIRSESAAVFLWLRPQDVRAFNWAFYVGDADYALQIQDSKPETLKGPKWVE